MRCRPAAWAARSVAIPSRARPRSSCSTRCAPQRFERAARSSAGGSARASMRSASARCADSGRCWRSSCRRSPPSARRGSPPPRASAASCCSRAASTATSSASWCRCRSTTTCSSVGSACWRKRLATQTLPDRREASATIPAAVDVRLLGVRKTYGDVVAVDHVDLEIEQGEFFTLLGPSGSGKTTTLRLIAGFERPDAGRVELSGRDVSNVPPYARDVNTVFQDYALFPHMTVAENVAYGLRIRGVGRRERRERAARALELVRLRDVGARKPAQLSGGQRQR